MAVFNHYCSYGWLCHDEGIAFVQQMPRLGLTTNSSARWHSLGVGLMSFGLGIAGLGVFNIMIAVDGASREPLPSWLMWFIAVGIPLWGCAGGGFGIYRFIMLGKTATSQAVAAARRDDCP
jgi:hypothetical protein